jgi:hypothetical protein
MHDFNLESKFKRELVVLEVEGILRVWSKFKPRDLLILFHFDDPNIVGQLGPIVEDVRRSDDENFSHLFDLNAVNKIVS